MYKILGILNVVLLILITSPYWLRRLAKLFFPKKRIATTKLMKFLRALHKPLGITLLAVTIAHGYLAWGSMRVHTGTLAGIAVFAAVVLGILFYTRKNPKLFKLHKLAALITVLLTLLHLIIPNAVYLIFG